MKKLSIAANLLAALAATAAFAQQPLPEVPPPAPAKSTVAAKVDDSAITSKVRDAISSDSAMTGLDFTVETTDSVVSINGTATSREQIARAVALARGVDGVKAVTNLLAVKTS